MKKNRIFLLLCCALLPALLRAQAPQERESILIISSYNPDTRRMSGFIAEFERNIMASGIPCDIYVETLECKSINDAPIWMSQTENMISRYENKGLRAIVLLGQEAWASFVSLDSFPQDIPFFGCYASTNGIPLLCQFQRHRAPAAGGQSRHVAAPFDQLHEHDGQPEQCGRYAQQV